MPKSAQVRALERAMKTGRDEDNLVDMRFDITTCTCRKCFPGPRAEPVQTELLLSCGGVWNRRSNAWEDDADACRTAVVSRVHPGQVAATRWFSGWLPVHAWRRDNPPTDVDLDDDEEVDTDPTRVYSALMSGGRRGGKSFWAALAIVAYAVQFPRAIIWCLSPSRGKDDTKPDEIRRYISPLLDPAWIRRQTIATGWELINGSQIMLKSGHAGADPDAIKEGQADLVWMNEAQKMPQRVYVVARGAIIDKSGLVLCCANPPVEALHQQWVSDFAADADAGRRASVHISFDPRRNTHVDRKALIAMRHEVDQRTYEIEALGMFLPACDAVVYNWSRKDNEAPCPEPELLPNGDQRPCKLTGLVDVTEEFLREIELGDGLRNLIGMDFQITPHMGGPVLRAYMDPEHARPTRDNVLLWGIDEIVLEGDELEWCAEAQRKGYRSEDVVIVGDGTGEYQHSRRGEREEPPSWHGRGSFDIIRMGGFRNITRPSLLVRRNNPHVLDRVRQLTSLVCNVDKVRRLFIDPERCPKTCKAMREWPTVHGKPSRTHEAAHLGDGTSYPIIRVFPRIQRSGNTDVGGTTIAQRGDQPIADSGDRFSGRSAPAVGKIRRSYGV
jgi:hypothetical protein